MGVLCGGADDGVCVCVGGWVSCVGVQKMVCVGVSRATIVHVMCELCML